jgi:uncharacterized membrane protein
MSPAPTLAIWIHLVSAGLALALGSLLLMRRKGSTSHRALGWVWVVLMASVAVSSLFIHSTTLPNIAGFTPIHLLTLMVIVMLPLAVYAARTHQVARHRKYMLGMFIGGLMIAGLFTLLPGRLLGNLLRQAWLG